MIVFHQKAPTLDCVYSGKPDVETSTTTNLCVAQARGLRRK
jgi:hypothetical protein